MYHFYQNIGHVFLLLFLLCCSAFFSGTETAYFNLSRRQIELLKKSSHKLSNMAANLLTRPKQLLSALLLGNMTVNVLFFAFSSILILKIEKQFGITTAAFFAIVSFVLLVLLGEIIPKSISYANSKHISVAAALPTYVCVKVFTPIVIIFRFLIVEPALVLILGPVKGSKTITTKEFVSLVEQIRKRGLITADENKVLGEIVELSLLKVSDCLRPRVDMITCDVSLSPQNAIEIMRQNNLTKLPVHVGKIDNIIGMLSLRKLLLEPDTSLDKLVGDVNFVPEQKKIESLLDYFRKTHTDTAIVVDEYGGIAGSICVEDIAEEVLGPMQLQTQAEPIEQIGPLEYRLAGDLAIHDWAKSFGIEIAQMRISTIGGLVTALLGKIPKEGDVAFLKNIKFTVEKVRKHRIETIILSLEPIIKK